MVYWVANQRSVSLQLNPWRYWVAGQLELYQRYEWRKNLSTQHTFHTRHTWLNSICFLSLHGWHLVVVKIYEVCHLKWEKNDMTLYVLKCNKHWPLTQFWPLYNSSRSQNSGLRCIGRTKDLYTVQKSDRENLFFVIAILVFVCNKVINLWHMMTSTC